MSCLCLLHIFTQMIVMEMIICLSLHIKKEAVPQLSVWDANREMLYGLRHTEQRKGSVMAAYYTLYVEQTPGLFCLSIPQVLCHKPC